MTAASPLVMWVVVIRGYGGKEEDEVAGVFGCRADAAGYADWWNREEIIRYGSGSPLTATVEEIDFYPSGTWRRPATTPATEVSVGGSESRRLSHVDGY